MQKLPDKLSELIRVGLADVRKAEQASDVYAVDMRYWHQPKNLCHPGRCAVCLAGSVMAFRLGAEPGRDLCPHDFDDGQNTRYKLRALDELVWGKISTALLELGEPVEAVDLLPERLTNRDVPEYEKGREAWHIEFAELADELEAAGY